MDGFLTAEASISSLLAAAFPAVAPFQALGRFARYLPVSAGALW
jgi:hypothetical protein